MFGKCLPMFIDGGFHLCLVVQMRRMPAGFNHFQRATGNECGQRFALR